MHRFGPLHCHFACWLDREGLGTVVKAAAEGELAGIGKLGVAGKTICKHCNVKTQCLRHPNMMELIRQYAQPYEQRDYRRVAAVAAAAE